MKSLRQKFGSWIAKRFNLKNPPQWFIDYFGGGVSTSGVSVNHRGALRFTPFWASVRVISGTIGALPFKVYRRREGGGKEPQSEHRVYSLLHDAPNAYMDAVTFIETRMAHVLTYGNGYAEIQRDGAGRPVALWPLLPHRTWRKVREDGTLYYEVQVDDAGTRVPIADANVLHIKGLGFDGYTGYDVVSYHRDAIGYGIATKEYGARFFANDASPGGVVEHPGPGSLSDAAFKHLKDSWNEAYGGLKNSHRVAILEEGAKFHPTGVEPAKAQMIETMKFTIDDCARIFGIPPHKIASMEFSKYANVSELNNDFYCSTMLYWFRKWEQEINRKLFGPSERGRLFVEILVDALLRGDLASRTAYYATGRQWGWLCTDDIREKENMNPLPDGKGKIYLEPLNMKPAGQPDPAAEPDPDANDDAERAHRALLAAQWQRIVTRVAKTSARKSTGNGFWAGERGWARDLLRDPVRAWAAVTGATDADAALDGMLDDTLCERWANDNHDPEGLAMLLMARIGEHHA